MLTKTKRFIDVKIIGTFCRWFNLKRTFLSETKKVRHLVLPFCIGKGCDIGFGGDKIVKTNCDGIDYPNPYAHTGKDKVDIACDVINNDIPVNDNTYDYVYSSHLIEDFVNTEDALNKFIKILKSGGNLILVFPDQPVYERYCLKNNQPLNPYHIHKNMGFDLMIKCLNNCKIKYELVYSSNCQIDYNVIIVVKILK